MGIGRVSLLCVLALAGCGLQVTGIAAESDAGASPAEAGPPSVEADDAASPDVLAPNVGATTTDAAAMPDAPVDAPPPSTLTVAWAPEPAAVDLDAEGTAAWIHWGRSNAQSINRKSAALASVLPDFVLTTRTGTPALLRYTDHGASIRWATGTPTTSESGTTTGVFSAGDQATFTFRVPIDAAAHRLILHTNVFRGIGRFGARLESGTARAVTRDVDAGNGDAYGCAQIDVQASAATVLVVTFELVSPANGDRNIAVAAATWR